MAKVTILQPSSRTTNKLRKQNCSVDYTSLMYCLYAALCARVRANGGIHHIAAISGSAFCFTFQCATHASALLPHSIDRGHHWAQQPKRVDIED